MVWSRVIPGVVLLGAVAAACITSREAVLSGHWAYPTLLVLVAAAGVALVVWGVRGKQPPGGVLRGLLRWFAALILIAIAGVTYWLAPFPAQVVDPTVLSDPAGVTVTSDAAGILLAPAGRSAEPTGVAFMPGALVDPRAYIPLWTPVAAAGYPVYIAKLPLGVAFFQPDVVARARAAAPEVSQWVVSGHSLGGAVGSDQAVRDGAGLILLGSYPIGDISGSTIPVLSISAGNDGLSTPADIQASRPDLPPDTEFVEIPGAVHAFFGDYGEQPGDGLPTITREEAQTQTEAAILAFLKKVNS